MFQPGSYFMTEDDQDAALGRLVATFSAAKKRRAALLSAAENIRSELNTAARSLDSLDFVSAFSDGLSRGMATNKALPKFEHTYPDPQRVRDLLDEIRAVSGEVRTLRERIKEAGLNVE